MFKFAEKRQVWWPVTIDVPIDGGATKPYEIEVLFELFTKAEARAAAMGNPAEAIAAKVRDWRTKTDTFELPTACTPDVVLAMFEHVYIERAFTAALMAASRGEAAAKNS